MMWCILNVDHCTLPLLLPKDIFCPHTMLLLLNNGQDGTFGTTVGMSMYDWILPQFFIVDFMISAICKKRITVKQLFIIPRVRQEEVRCVILSHLYLCVIFIEDWCSSTNQSNLFVRFTGQRWLKGTDISNGIQKTWVVFFSYISIRLNLFS